MTDLENYCDDTFKRLVGLKAGLYDVLVRAEEMEDVVHPDAARQLRLLVEGIEAGIEALRDQCPADWSPNRNDLDQKMSVLEKRLNTMAEKLGVVIPDTTAWI